MLLKSQKANDGPTKCVNVKNVTYFPTNHRHRKYLAYRTSMKSIIRKSVVRLELECATSL